MALMLRRFEYSVVYVYICMSLHVDNQWHMYTCVCVCVRVCEYVCVYVCVCRWRQCSAGAKRHTSPHKKALSLLKRALSLLQRSFLKRALSLVQRDLQYFEKSPVPCAKRPIVFFEKKSIHCILSRMCSIGRRMRCMYLDTYADACAWIHIWCMYLVTWTTQTNTHTKGGEENPSKMCSIGYI